MNLDHVFFHADDYGLSINTNKNIEWAIENKILTSVSLVPNGLAINDAANFLKDFPDLKVSIHLTLNEGAPLSGREKIPLLIDKNGDLKLRFGKIIFWGVLFFHPYSKQLYRQILCEVESQIDMIRAKFPGRDLAVDSHQHYHMIPFLFSKIAKLVKEKEIHRIRLSKEAFIFLPNYLSVYLSMNLIKFIILRILSSICSRYVKNYSLKSFDYIGILFTNKMNHEYVTKALLKKKSDRSIEVVFHPGRSSIEESHSWGKDAYSRSFYCAIERDNELEEMKLSYQSLRS